MARDGGMLPLESATKPRVAVFGLSVALPGFVPRVFEELSGSVVEVLFEHPPHWCRRKSVYTASLGSLFITLVYALLDFGVFREVKFIYSQF